MNGLRQTNHRLRNHFGCTGWYIEVMRVKWKLISVLSKEVLILTQDRCMVFVERTMGSDIVLDALDATSR